MVGLAGRRIPPGLPPAGPVRAGAGKFAFGPCPAQGGPAPPATERGDDRAGTAASSSSARPTAGHPGHRDRHRHRHPPLRHRRRPLLEPVPPQAHPSLVLGRVRGTLPIVEGTVIRLAIDHLPRAALKPAWLWWSGTDARATDTDRLRRAYLRRFDRRRRRCGHGRRSFPGPPGHLLESRHRRRRIWRRSPSRPHRPVRAVPGRPWCCSPWP